MTDEPSPSEDLYTAIDAAFRNAMQAVSWEFVEAVAEPVKGYISGLVDRMESGGIDLENGYAFNDNGNYSDTGAEMTARCWVHDEDGHGIFSTNPVKFSDVLVCHSNGELEALERLITAAERSFAIARASIAALEDDEAEV